ncbi:ribonuclease H-like domain-containing protein [Mycena latifolia]|nr:ribonuclease H-like domain-containing protein [Mycena latifolia]
MARGVSEEQYETFKTASQRFLTEKDFSFPQVEAAMNTVFGQDRGSKEARAWKTYWDTLGVAEERNSNGQEYCLPPMPLIDGSVPDVDMVAATPSATPRMLSNDTLNSDKADRARERAERKNNGNKHGKEKKGLGRTFDEVMASVFIERESINSNNVMKAIYYCIGCDSAVRNNTRSRNASHMTGCKALQRDFPDTWSKFKQSIDPSSEDIASGAAPAPSLRSKKRKIEDPAEGRVPIPGITTELPSPPESSQKAAKGQRTLDGTWGETSITATRQSVIDYLLLRLIISVTQCAPPTPSLIVPALSHTTWSRRRRMQLKTLLESFIHLTLSFDGWSSHRSDEIYTVHVTTPTRMSYIVAGIILTGLSTTSETIFGNLKDILLLYAAVRFSMIVSDTTGNVKKCRALICDAFPWILNCPDPCHQLNLLAKEIMVGSKKHPKIHGFTAIMKIISAIMTFFSHSNYGKKHLRDKLKEGDNRRGLISFGATRFSTFADQSSSVSRCLTAMGDCFKEGLVKFDTKATKPLQQYFINDSPAQLQFRLQLYNINMLLKPIARGLKTLESSQVTCSDVFTIWIGIAIGFQEVFVNPADPINKYHQETFDCYNRRFAIFMNDCTPGMFILSYLLDPVYYRDSALRLGLPTRQNFSKKSASPLVSYLITSARTMLRNEQIHEQKGDSSEGDILVNQLISYMYREAPFDLPCAELSLRLGWWKALSKDSNSYVLARLGIKVFSVVPSEMPDERTASRLTAMSTAKRNNLGGLNLVRLAQLNQYWRYGFGSPEIQRHCQKVRLELPTPNRKPSDPVVAGIPTLQDLLNADSVDDQPIDEEALFNHPDPYGIKDLEEMEEGEDETDATPPPLVIRRANLPTLEIEAYIDLKAPKLTQRFAPDQGKPEQTSLLPTKPAKEPGTKWTAADAEWDASDW